MTQTPDADTGPSDGSTSAAPGPGAQGRRPERHGQDGRPVLPGRRRPGTTYGGSSGTGTEEREVVGADEDADVGQTAEGDAEGA
jgi:hypothetical protein